MFGTLRYNAPNDDTQFIEPITNPIDAEGDGEGLRSSACENCRSKKKCNGQPERCDRCKRNFGTCVCSLQGKGKGHRQPWNTEGKNITSRDSSLRSPRPARPSTDLEASSLESSGRTMMPTQQISMVQNEEKIQDSTNSGSSPVGSFDYSFLVSDQMMDDMLPGVDGQSVHTCLDTSTLSNIYDMNFDDIFPNGLIGSSPEDELSSVPPMTGQQSLRSKNCKFNLNTYFTNRSLPCCFDTTGGTRPIPQDTTSPPSQPITECRADHQTKPTSTCRCLNTISLLLSELEAKAQLSNHSAKLDSVLVFQKEALARSNSVLNCSTCFPRPEYILLLSMVTERLVSLFESTVEKHLESVSFTQHIFRQAAVATGANVSHQHHTSSLDGESNIFLGSYEIETPEEYNRLMRVLLAMQLQTLWKFTVGMKKAAESEASSKSKIQALEKRVVRLLRRIRHFRG